MSDSPSHLPHAAASATGSPAEPSRPARGVTWTGLLILTFSWLALLFGLTAAIGYELWRHYTAQVQIVDHQADIILPQGILAKGEIVDKVKVRLDHTMRVQVPIEENIMVPLKDPMHLQVQFSTDIPVNIDVPIEHTVHINQNYELNTQVQAHFWGMDFVIPIKTKIPLKLDIPINLVVPFNKKIPVSLDVPATVKLTEPVEAHVSTIITSDIPIQTDLTLPVTAPVKARMSFPEREVMIGVRRLNAQVPLETIKLRRTEQAQPTPSTATRTP